MDGADREVLDALPQEERDRIVALVRRHTINTQTPGCVWPLPLFLQRCAHTARRVRGSTNRLCADAALPRHVRSRQDRMVCVRGS